MGDSSDVTSSVMLSPSIWPMRQCTRPRPPPLPPLPPRRRPPPLQPPYRAWHTRIPFLWCTYIVSAGKAEKLQLWGFPIQPGGILGFSPYKITWEILYGAGLIFYSNAAPRAAFWVSVLTKSHGGILYRAGLIFYSNAARRAAFWVPVHTKSHGILKKLPPCG